MDVKWSAPEVLQQPAPGGSPLLTDQQVAQWRKAGYLALDGLLPPELVERVRTAAGASGAAIERAPGGGEGLPGGPGAGRPAPLSLR